VPYKVNIYAMVEDADSLNESKELHEKVIALYPQSTPNPHSPQGDHAGGGAISVLCF
jgi:hypothetical protein